MASIRIPMGYFRNSQPPGHSGGAMNLNMDVNDES